MTWHAMRAAGESVTATRRLLAGAPLSAWLRLSVLALFVGTLLTPFLVDFNRGSALLASVPDSPWLFVAIALATLAALCVGTVFEFVFLEALRGERVRLVADSGRRFRAGLEVFALRAALAAVLALALGAFALVDAPLALIPLVALAVVLAVLDRLTVAFVIPIMLVDDRSLPKGWRAFSPTLCSEWHEYALYLLVAAVLWSAIAVVGGLAGALLAGALLVPFAILGGAVGGALLAQGLSEAAVGQAVTGTLAVPYLLAFATLILLVHVPLVAYLRYIALFVLGDTDERYDPIPRLRAAIRRGRSGGGRRAGG